jgi:hypothetical protein
MVLASINRCLMLAKGVLPDLALFRCGKQRLGLRSDNKRQVFPKFDLSQKNVEGIAGFHAKPSKNLFSPFKPIGRHASPKKNGICHGSKVLNVAHMGK